MNLKQSMVSYSTEKKQKKDLVEKMLGEASRSLELLYVFLE